MEIQFLTVNPFQTKKLGKILAEEILKTKPKKTALLIGLEGSLGGGKTTFLQGFARGLRIKEKILSPTFIIMRKFEIRPQPIFNGLGRPAPPLRKGAGLWQNSEFKNFYHIDCYRIEKPKEILDLGFKEIISNPQNIVTIEWAEKIKKVLPRNTIWINFEFIDKNTRKLIIKK